MKKRVLSILLVITLILTSADITVFAAEQTDEIGSAVEEETGVLKITQTESLEHVESVDEMLCETVDFGETESDEITDEEVQNECTEEKSLETEIEITMVSDEESKKSETIEESEDQVTFSEDYTSVDETESYEEETVEIVRDEETSVYSTVSDVVHVYSAKDLLEISDNISNEISDYNGVTIYIEDNIDLSGISWSPIGNIKPFCGSIQGNGYTISGISCGTERSGLIGYWNVTGECFIENLLIDSFNLGGKYSGGIASNLNILSNGKAIIQNCSVTGYINGEAMTSGGVIGTLSVDGNFEIRNCKINVSITSSTGGLDNYGCVGGIMSKASGSGTAMISECSVNGNLNTKQTWSYCTSEAGGLIGYSSLNNVIIERCSKEGEVACKAYYAYTGGFVGRIDLNTTSKFEINNSYVSASIIPTCTNGTSQGGGLIGATNGNGGSQIYITNSYVTGSITAGNKAGFVCWHGGSDCPVIKNSYFNKEQYSLDSDNMVSKISLFKTEWLNSNISGSSGLSTADMMKQSSYQGWDFNNIWVIKNDYPLLRVFVNDNNENIPNGTCGENLTWSIINEELIISGTGEMYDFYTFEGEDIDPAPWDEFAEIITSVTVEKGVTSIGNSAFVNLQANLISVEGRVKNIGKKVFSQWTPKIIFKSDAPEQIDKLAFDNSGSGKIIDIYYNINKKEEWKKIIDSEYDSEYLAWIYSKDATQKLEVEDMLSFANIPENFGNSYNDKTFGYYISQDDYDRLLSNLDAKEKKAVTLLKTNSFLYKSIYNVNGKKKNVREWGGSCRGMSSLIALVKNNIFTLSSFNESLVSISELKGGSIETQSLINFYQWQQRIPTLVELQTEFLKKPQEDQIRQLDLIVSEAEKNGTVVLIDFGYKSEDEEKKGEKKEYKESHHTILGFAVEYGTFNFTFADKKYKFDRRILTYDPVWSGDEQEFRNSAIYYNDHEWAILGWYNAISKKEGMDIESIDNTGQLEGVISDVGYINAVDYFNGKKNYNPSLENVILYAGNQNLTVTYSTLMEKIVNGLFNGTKTISDSGATIVKFANNTNNLNFPYAVVLPNQTNKYTITSDEMMDFSMMYENYYFEVDSNQSGSAIFESSGKVTLNTELSGKSNLGITADEGYYSLPWYTIEVNSANIKELSLELIDEGVLLFGDNLNNTTVYGSNDKETKELTFSTEQNTVLVKDDENGNICIFEDSDDNGTYKKKIATSNKDVKKLSLPKSNYKSGLTLKKGTKLELISDEGASVYYTTDGTNPTESSNLYAEEIIINKDIVIKAIAIEEGYLSSDIVIFSFAVDKDFIVTFNSNGGSNVENQVIKESEKAIEPIKPVKEGYVFDGWYLNGVLYDFNTIITSDIILEAGWTELGMVGIPTPSIASESKVKIGTELKLISDEGAKIYYTLDGTEPDITNNHAGILMYTNPIVITEDIIIKAIAVKDGCRNSDIVTFIYTIVTEYTVTFKSNGGSNTEPQSIEENGKAKKPDNPVKEGYRFTGWYLDGVLYDFDTEVTSEIVLEAGWTELGKVRTPTPSITSESKVKSGTELELISDEGAKIYYTLDGTEPDITDDNVSTFLYTMPIIIMDNITVKTIAVKDGYRNSDIAIFTYTLATEYIVTFNSNGGTNVDPQIILENCKIAEPLTPIKEDFVFTGWYLDGVLYDFDTAVTSDIILEARWVEVGKITAPTANIASGSTVKLGTRIRLTCADNALIYYTLDETIPTISSILFTDDIVINERTIIRAFAVKEGHKDSDIATFIYEISENKSDFGDVLIEDIPESGIPNGLWIAGVGDVVYTGKAIKPLVRVYDYKTRLIEKQDYTISYKNNVCANDTLNESNAPSVIIKAKGNYSGKEVETFKILAKDINSTEFDVADIVAKPTKKVQNPVPILTFNGKKLSNKKDFTVSYPDMSAGAYKEEGTYAIKIAGKGNYTGERIINFTITNNNLITKAQVSKINNQQYTGMVLNPKVEVKYGKTVLKEGMDYELEYKNNTQIGTASIIIKGKGEYCGQKSVPFKITGISIRNGQIMGLDTPRIYNGSEINKGYYFVVFVNGNQRILKEGQDYTITFKNNKKAGKATAILTGINGYSGTLEKIFKIDSYDIQADKDKKITYNQHLSVPYSKNGSCPEPVIYFGGTRLVNGKDYSLSYKNNNAVNNGSYTNVVPTIIVRGKGNFKGTISIPFTITPRNISSLTLAVNDKVYKNRANIFAANIKITDKNGKTLGVGKDYDKDSIVYTYVNNVNLENGVTKKAGDNVEKTDIIPAGTKIQVAVTAKAGGYYTGTVKGTYRIIASDIKKAKVSILAQTYTGKTIVPKKSDINVTVGETKLTESEFEIVSCTNNIKKGNASITIKGKGNYGGTKTVHFKIQSKGFLWWWRK